MSEDLELRTNLSWSIPVGLLHMMKQRISLEKLAGPQMPGWIWGNREPWKGFKQSGGGRICGSEGSLQPESGRERWEAGRPRGRLERVCWRGCENCGDRRRGTQVAYTCQETGW